MDARQLLILVLLGATQQPPCAAQNITFMVVPLATSGGNYGAVDMNNDGYDDVVSVTGSNIQIFHQQPDGELLETNYPTTVGNPPSWSMAAGDIDGNGFLDLLYGHGSGVRFMYANADGTAFTPVSGSEFVFSQRSNFVDINNDGYLDAFVCHDIEPNVSYINDGTGTLVFNQGGLGDTPEGGNYGSIWIDYNNDHLIDLHLSKCRGGNSVASTDQLYRNNGDGTFTEVAGSAGLSCAYQDWSSAWGDYDNDGDMDVMVGASSGDDGGNHILFRNDDGQFNWEGPIVSGVLYPNTDWRAHDFDNDGWVDICRVGGTIFRNMGDMTFESAGGSTDGPIADLNNDGFLDVLSSVALKLNNGNSNNWLRVNLHGTTSNRNGIGARVRIDTPAGSQIRDVVSGDGFKYMSFIGAHFGLGQATQVDQITVHWPSGTVDVITDPAINNTLVITEGSPTAVETIPRTALMIGPNPASDILSVFGAAAYGNTMATIVDLTGREVLITTLNDGRLDVSGIGPGQYLLLVGPQGAKGKVRFIKE